jgi:malate dehydrogenase (oxaloacetate-decarboxylating)(NADP+)
VYWPPRPATWTGKRAGCSRSWVRALVPTKPLATQRDLSLAYSPGVAAACNEIVRDPARLPNSPPANLVGVVTNGTAVLGLGNIGPLAAKPVMEGKGVLFKKFAGIDVFDIEIDENRPDKLVDIVAALEPTFGGINLEDIKAPECFYVEQKLRERMKIPVFHDDQHGTAIIVGAAILNGLARRQGHRGGQARDLRRRRRGARLPRPAGEARPAAREHLGHRHRKGVVYKGRNELMDPSRSATQGHRGPHARRGDRRRRRVPGPVGRGVLKPEMVAMAARPLIFALANPNPGDHAGAGARRAPDAIIATGRSDYPNQVNNVLCFPFIFRGALDVGATTINDEMKLACVKALAGAGAAGTVGRRGRAYGEQAGGFGPEYLIPKPFDPRLIVELAPAVAKAAMESGVATRPIADFDAYRQQLSQFVFKSGLVMRPVFVPTR